MIKKQFLAVTIAAATSITFSSFGADVKNNEVPQESKLNKIAYIPFVANAVHYKENDHKGELTFYNVCKVPNPISSCDKNSKKVNIKKIARYVHVRLQDNIPVAIYVKLPHKNQYHVDCHVAKVELAGDVLHAQCQETLSSEDLSHLNKATYNRVIVASKADPKISQLMKMTFGE